MSELRKTFVSDPDTPTRSANVEANTDHSKNELLVRLEGHSTNSSTQLMTTDYDSSGNEIESKPLAAFTDNLDGQYGKVTASAMFGRVSDTVLVPIKVDGSTQDIQVIMHEHAEIHSADHYEVCSYVAVSINDVVDIQITTPNTTKWGHFVFSIEPSGETLWEFYENVTINVAGTTKTPRNNQRNSSNTAALTIAVISNSSTALANADTAIASATLLEDGKVGSGKQSGGTSQRSRELVLKQNTAYSLRSTAVAAGYINYCLSWYEHTDKN